MPPQRRTFKYPNHFCEHPGCDRSFTNKSGLTQHRRLKHALLQASNLPVAQLPPDEIDDADAPVADADIIQDHNLLLANPLLKQVGNYYRLLHPIIDGMFLSRT